MQNKQSNFDSIFDKEQIKILQQVIYPNKLRQDIKTLMLKLVSGQKNVRIKVFDESIQKGSSSFIKISVMVPILVYTFFHHKPISFNLQYKQFKQQQLQSAYNIIQTNYQQQEFNKNNKPIQMNKKMQKFIIMLQNKQKESTKRVNKIQRIMQNQQQNVNKKITKGQFLILSFLYNTISSYSYYLFMNQFFQLLTLASQNLQYTIDQMRIHFQKIFYKQPQSIKKIIKQKQKKAYFNLWKYIYTVYSIQKITLNDVYQIELSQTLLQYLNIRKQQNTQFKYIQNTYSLKIQGTSYQQQNVNVYQSEIFIQLLQIFPRIKQFTYEKIFDRMSQQIEHQIKNVYKLFKFICQNNPFIQKLIFNKIKQLYFQSQKNKNKMITQNQQIKNQYSDSQYDSEQQQQFITECNSFKDKDIYWLNKLYYSCPFLSNINIQYHEPTQHEIKNMLPRQFQQYKKKKQIIKKIIQVYNQRATNLKDYFNQVKILQTQGYGFQTTADVLSIYDPFILK